MIEELRLLWLLDFISEKAKEFVTVSDEVLEGEQALQAKNGIKPTEWQVCSTISAFINFIAESERHRYGHFVYDIEKKNNENKLRLAKNTLARMKFFWDIENFDDASEDEQKQKNDLIKQFIENDEKIRKHLSIQPNFYDTEDKLKHQEQILREWSVKLRILGENELSIFKEWEKFISSKSEIHQNDLQHEIHDQKD